jgi:hypothetical protein
MRAACLGVVIFAILAAPSSAPAKTYRFDMGTEQSELRTGFTRVTPASKYTKKLGYGWGSTDALEAQAKHYGAQWQRDEHRGTDEPPPIYTNELTCDAVYSKRPGTFLVDLPPGDYEVYVLSGCSAPSPQFYHSFEIAVGQNRASVKIPGPYIFERRVLKATVKQLPLAVEFLPTTDWVVAGVIVYPVAEAAAVRAELLDPLEREIDFLPPEVARRWRQTPPVEATPPPALRQTDRGRGYAVFARHWSEPIYPDTVPRTGELDPKLEAFAAWGQYESVTFTVLPLRDLSGVIVKAGELRLGQAIIPARNVDVRSVRYMQVRPNYAKFFSYHIAPDVLEHRESLALRRGCNQTWWITVKVPDDAVAGVYEGALTFRPADAAPVEVPLRLRVLPIRLRKNTDYIYGMFYRDPLGMWEPKGSVAENEYFVRKAELERQDMADHGMNTHVSTVSGLARDPQGRWTIDGADTERRIFLDRRFGLADKPLVVSLPVEEWYIKLVDKRGLGNHLRLVPADVPQSFFDNITRMVETTEQERRLRGWPEFLYYPVDEPELAANPVRFTRDVLKAIRRVPGVRTFVTADPSEEQFAPLWPYVDVWCCQPFVFDCEKIHRLSREKHIEFWCYPNHISGENDHTPVRGARMTWGFGFWRSGFKAVIPWIYQWTVGNPWNYLDGDIMDFMIRSTPDGEPIPVALWEAYRAGIDDGRYLYTLEQLVAEGKQKGGRAALSASEGERELKRVWDAIAVQPIYQYKGLWSGAEFDAYRWRLAAKILELQEALK